MARYRVLERRSGWEQWIDPPQRRKTGEIPIRRIESTAPFQGESSQPGVRHQGALRLTVDGGFPEQRPVPLSRPEQPDIRLFEPSIDNLDRLLDGEAIAGKPRIRDDSEEGAKRFAKEDR
jgi:hypothetical protein